MLGHLESDEIRMLEDEIPVGRLARPDEIHPGVFSGAESGYITGQVISPNGGWVT